MSRWLAMLAVALLLSAPLLNPATGTLAEERGNRAGPGTVATFKPIPDAESVGRGGDRRANAKAVVPRDLVRPALARAARSGGARSLADRWIVILRDDAGDPSRVADEWERDYGATVFHVYRLGFLGLAVALPGKALQRARNDPRVASMAPDRPVALPSPEPRRGAEGPGREAGRSVDALGVPAAVYRIEAAPAWKNRTANIDGVDGPNERVDVDVAILDTGVDASHPDLNLVGGFDCTGAGWGSDEANHGTKTAGVIGALDDKVGMVGVAPGARLWSVRYYTSNTSPMSAVVCGAQYIAANPHIFEVALFNIQYGPYSPSIDDRNCGNTDWGPTWADHQALHSSICAARQAGIILVAAAGNYCDDATMWAPAAYDEVITVGAFADTDGQPGGRGAPARGGSCDNNSWVDVADDTVSSFSNYGPDVDIWAPGVAGWSTWSGGGYGTYSGTSMASPYAAGALALFAAANPGATPDQAQTWLRANREQRSLANPLAGTGGDTRTGPYAQGILNVNDRLAWAKPPANDAIGRAVAITRVPFKRTVVTDGATAVSGDPSCIPTGGRNYPLARTIWYRFKLSGPTKLAFNTTGSAYDTIAGVYAGKPGLLRQVRCNDDPSPTNRQAKMTLKLKKGSYYLMVAGFSGHAPGKLVLSVRGVTRSGGRLNVAADRAAGGDVAPSVAAHGSPLRMDRARDGTGADVQTRASGGPTQDDAKPDGKSSRIKERDHAERRRRDNDSRRNDEGRLDHEAGQDSTGPSDN